MEVVMIRKMRGMGLLIVSAIFMGCSTTTRVFIDSFPTNAQVVMDGKVIGNTPIRNYRIKNRIGKEYFIVLTKEGYEPLQATLKTEIKAASFIGAALFGDIPLVWFEGPQKGQYFILREKKNPKQDFRVTIPIEKTDLEKQPHFREGQ